MYIQVKKLGMNNAKCVEMNMNNVYTVINPNIKKEREYYEGVIGACQKDPNAQLTQPPADGATIRLREGYDFNILGENPITKNLWIVIDNR